MTRLLFTALLVASLCGTGFLSADEEPAAKPQTACPIMGGQIDKKLFTDHDGKRIYFCCKGCPETFKKDAAKYVTEMEDAGIVLEDAPKPQTACPVMGGDIDKELFADHQGKRIYFCCKGCPEALKKDPAKYIKVLEDDGVTIEKTPVPQTTCPLMGRKINKTIFVDHDGNRIYLCCNGCIGKFNDDSGKYLKKLEDAGVTLEKSPEPAAADETDHHQACRLFRSSNPG